ncbi:transcriptional regulator [Inquilinus sp. CA228]|uniref:transcriptional regulator n=1 Tax=Inquilinus sp. CA228 TaxID=3455609 RepID=UPI003F8D2D7C
MSNSALERAVAAKGGQTAFARAIGRKQQTVWWWLHKSGRVPAEDCIRIELAVEGAVKRHELRPDIFPPPAEAAA